MAYITLNELKEILPIILEHWIDEDDESWEWIFQEIEQKCHVIQWINPIDTKRKGKKWKKRIENDICQMKSMVDTHSVVLSAHRNDINELVDKVSKLNDVCNAHTVRLDHMGQDIAAAKSMAETAKRRTEVDYTKCSQNNKEKYDQPITAANKCGSCKYLSKLPIDQPCIDCCYNGMNISGNDKWEAKDNG